MFLKIFPTSFKMFLHPHLPPSSNKAQAAIHRIHGTAFSSVSAHVIRSELASLQPSKYIMTLGAANRANAAAAVAAAKASAGNKKLSKKATRKLQRQHELPIEGVDGFL
jgi:hypothetical protein